MRRANDLDRLCATVSSDTDLENVDALKVSLVNRPGFPGGSIPWEDGVYGTTRQVLT
jgi:hypothetical protein